MSVLDDKSQPRRICFNCGFYQLGDFGATGDPSSRSIACRRFPPRVIGSGKTAWPAPYPTDWCGEWVLSDEASVFVIIKPQRIVGF